MKSLLVFILLMPLVACYTVKAQKIGKPFVQAYPAKLYGSAAQNWGISQDKRGVMYFANDEGVLEYDGKNWQKFTLPNNEPVRAIRISEDGRVYVGGVGEFGYLAPNNIGVLVFHSLKSFLPDSLRFEDIWSIQATPEMVYFQTDSYLFGYRPHKQEKLTIWKPPHKESDFFLTFYANGTLFLHSRKSGLFILNKQGTIEQAYMGEMFAESRIYTMLPISTNEILIGSREKGLFMLQQSAAGKSLMRKLEGEANDFIMQHQIYNGDVLPEGKAVLCTRKAGAIVVDRQGRITEMFNKQTGLTDENIRAAYLGADNILWFALDNGINHVSYVCPIRTWDESRGIRGTVRAIQEFNDQTYIATSLGIFVLNKQTDKFEAVQGVATESWCLANFKIYGAEKLLAGTNEGIFEIQGNQATLVYTSKKAVRTLLQSVYTPNRLYVGQKGGLISLRYTQGSWIDEGAFQHIAQEIISIIESPINRDELWIGTFTEGVFKISHLFEKRTAEIKHYHKHEGLPTMRELSLYQWQNDLYICSPQGLFIYNPQQDKFALSELWATQFPQGKRGAYRLAIDKKDNIWLADRDTRKHSIGHFQKKGNGMLWSEGAIKRLPEFSEPSLHIDTKNMLWVGGTDGLYRYNTTQLTANTPAFRALIREVKLQEDSVVFGGAFSHTDGFKRKSILAQQPIGVIPSFEFHGMFEISFQCAAPFYDVENRTEFSYYLEGYDKPLFGRQAKDLQWSVWTRESKRSYTNLPEGTYAFYVKARNVYGEESLLASYRFHIRAPWYRTLPAYMLYLVLAVILIYVITTLYTRNLRNQKERLEEIVTERTRELVESSKKLELTHQLLVKHNTDLNDSIDYASRIQHVMLPKTDVILSAFPNSFIFWKPLQKVSGDFYWFAETNMEPRFAKDPHVGDGKVSIFKGFVEGKKIIAAIDCTGHGIPGAFMSMMGDAYLDQIVNNEGITQPQLILQELDLFIRAALKQDEGQNADGMDMAMCVVNPNQNIIEFAGAKNGLIYVKAGEATIIRGDRFGIGGGHHEDDEKPFEKVFTRHVIPIDQPTALYLYSDGLPDQFGGDKAKKFSTKQMLTFFASQFENDMQIQYKNLQLALSNWMINYEQIDDILVIGVKVEVS